MVKTKEYMRSYRTGKKGALPSFADFYGKYPSRDVPWDIRSDFLRDGLNRDSYYQLWLEETGDYQKADVVPQEELERLYSTGEYTAIYRGMPDSVRSTGREKLENVMYSDRYYTGKGSFGDGLYFSDGFMVPKRFAAERDGESGSMMFALIKNSARIISYDDLGDELSLDIERGKVPNVESMSYGNISAYARSKGYDIIDCGVHHGETYYNVLNRNSIIIGDRISGITAKKVDGKIVRTGEYETW